MKMNMRMITHPLNLHPLYSTTPHWNHSLSDYGGKRPAAASSSVVSTRWNPTAEQLQALEEMYKRGTRTPSAQQIQQIAAKLRKFGKIEGKNVFYWFQNHKARDRQKKRRSQIEIEEEDDDLSSPPGLSKRARLESGHPKKLLPTLSICTTTSKWCESMPGAVDQQLQKKYSDVKGENAYAAYSFCSKTLGSKSDNFRDLGARIEEDKTLELFPIKSSNDLDNDDGSSCCRLVPNQFFEFLPTKK